MRSKRVAQTCDVIGARSAVAVTIRHGLEVPPATTRTLRICVDATAEMHHWALAKVPGSAVAGQGR